MNSDQLSKQVREVFCSVDFRKILENQHRTAEIMGSASLRLGEEQGRFSQMARSIDFRGVFQNQQRIAEMLRSIGKNFHAIAEAQKRFDARFPGFLRTLAQHGWYISVWHTALEDIPPLVSLLEKGNIKEADQRLCKHFNELCGEIQADLSERFPARAVIIKKAFDAHRRSDFELAIPVLLAQADGIMIDIVGKPEKKYSIYSRRKMPMLRDLVESITTVRLEKDILEVALLEMPLKDTEAHKFASGEVLNRNAVQHGINTTYGNEPNSCRAISWLQYVAHFEEAKRIAGRRKTSSDSSESF